MPRRRDGSIVTGPATPVMTAVSADLRVLDRSASSGDPVRVVYIIGTSHSGSTLLDMLIASHSRVVSVGEAKTLTRAPSVRCACGVRPGLDCPFWRAVGAEFERETGRGLEAIELDSASDERAQHDSISLYRAVRRVAARPVIVDSSKDLQRLQRLLGLDEAIEVVPVHIVRDPRGVVSSEVRKGRSWLRGAWQYAATERAIRRALRRRPHVEIRYEDLATDPAGTLAGLMPRLGLEFEPGQLEWGPRERHNFGGNRVRKSRGSTIRLDTSWRQRLPRRQRLAVRAIAALAAV
jgi:hypothetical protein